MGIQKLKDELKGFNCAYLYPISPNKIYYWKYNEQYKFPKTLRRLTTQLPSTFYELLVDRTSQCMSLLRINTHSHVSKWSLPHNRVIYIGDKKTAEANWLKIFNGFRFNIKIWWSEKLSYSLGILGSEKKKSLNQGNQWHSTLKL